jgi:hypothetical protein
MTKPTSAAEPKSAKHALIAFVLVFAWVFVISLLWNSAANFRSALLESFALAAVVATLVAALTAIFGRRVVIEVKAFIEWAGLS